MKFAIIDVETTGSSLSQPNRIIEIGVVISDGYKVIDQYSSLINPHSPIDPFVKKLTGIDESMLKDQPQFKDIAKKILKMTEDTIFVAHNVGFDYSMISKEFELSKLFFKRSRLCTVKLSRLVYPTLDGGHSLANLTDKFKIKLKSHHRALDDALATQMILANILKEKGEEWLQSHVSGYINSSNLPNSIKLSDVAELPEQCGLFSFYDKKYKQLYLSYSSNILSSVTAFFNSPKKKGAASSIRSAINSMDWTSYPSELLARLLYADQILDQKPPGNRNYRVTRFEGEELKDCILLHGHKDQKIVFVWLDNKLAGWKVLECDDQFCYESIEQLNSFKNAKEISPIFRKWLLRKKFGTLKYLYE